MKPFCLIFCATSGLIEHDFWKGQGKIFDFSSKNVASVTVSVTVPCHKEAKGNGLLGETSFTLAFVYDKESM